MVAGTAGGWQLPDRPFPDIMMHSCKRYVTAREMRDGGRLHSLARRQDTHQANRRTGEPRRRNSNDLTGAPARIRLGTGNKGKNLTRGRFTDGGPRRIRTSDLVIKSRRQTPQILAYQGFTNGMNIARYTFIAGHSTPFCVRYTTVRINLDSRAGPCVQLRETNSGQGRGSVNGHALYPQNRSYRCINLL